MDNLEFRSAAQRTISQLGTQIQYMISPLYLLSQKLNVVNKETNLNELDVDAVSGVKGYVNVPTALNLNNIPLQSITRAQILKVLENFLMNAYNAFGQEG
jgi:hypothetical protein